MARRIRKPRARSVSAEAPDLERLAETFKALAHPHRLIIFARLAAGCCRPGSHHGNEIRACVGELGAGLDIAPSTLSHHIKELRRAGLLHVRKRGTTCECWVEAESLTALARFFSEAVGGRARRGRQGVPARR